jgi:mannitol-specific phosphotransferase system IIBC component
VGSSLVSSRFFSSGKATENGMLFYKLPYGYVIPKHMRHGKVGEYMKKVLAILVSLLFSFSVTAFAQETAPADTGTPQVEQQSKSVKAKKTVKKAKKKKAKKTKKSKKTKETEQENPQ